MILKCPVCHKSVELYYDKVLTIQICPNCHKLIAVSDNGKYTLDYKSIKDIVEDNNNN